MPRMIPTECRDDAVARGRWAGALAAALLGATAVVLALTAAVLAEPTPAALLGLETETLVRRYYASFNTALATGNLALLEHVVAADAHLTPASAEPAPARATLATNIATLRAAQPNLRIVVERVVADRDEAVAWASLAGVAGGDPVVAPSIGHVGELLDGFRVRGGQIAELWGATPGLRAPAPMIRADLDPAPGPVLVGLVRLEVAPDAETPTLSGPGPTVVTVEIGTLQVRMDGSGDVIRGVSSGQARTERTVPRIPASLGPGDQLVVSAAKPFRLRNEGQEPVAAILAAVFPSAIVAAPPPAFDNAGLDVRSLLVEMVRSPNTPPPAWAPQGIAIQRLVVQTLTDVPFCPMRLDVQRMRLGPDAEAARWRPTGQVWLAVEHGAAVATASRSTHGDSPRSVFLAADGSASAFEPGTPVAVRGAGDDAVSVILFSLRASPTIGLPNSHLPCVGAGAARSSGPR